MTTEIVQLIVRVGTSAQWSTSNPILALGEQGWDSTLKKMKVGDGVTSWNSLAFQSSGGGAWGSISGTLSDQTDLQNALNAKADDGDIPTTLAELSDDSTHRTVTDTEKSTWNGKADSGDIPTALSELSDDTTHRLVTDTEKSTWNAKQDALGFTAVPNTRAVAGHALSADVTLAKADVGLGNVDNTSDANKPVSTAQGTAIGLKQDTLVSGTNIKTVNSQSLLGSGNISIAGTSGTTTVYFSGESDVAITTGEKQPLIVCPVAGTIVGWRMTSYPATTAAVSIWKANNARPTVANKITASAPPILTASAISSGTTLTGWTTSVAAGDAFVMYVDSNSAATTIYVALEIQ